MARVRGGQIYSQEVLDDLKTTMAVQSRQDQDDEATFRQKMNALQRFLNHGMSRFSIDSWHQALTILFQSYQLISLPQQPSAQAPHISPRPNALTKLGAVNHLRQLSRDMLMQREGGSLREADTQALRLVDNFLAAVRSLQEAKACITELKTFLYRYYYNPLPGRQNTQVHSGKALSRSSTVNPSQGGPEGKAFQTSAKQFGILTLQQMTGSTDHKLRRTVADMQAIMTRWDRLTTEEDIHSEDLDAESEQDLHLLSGTALFEPVLRLLPDMFAKFYKCLELLKQWWVLAHEIYPELPINRPLTAPTKESSSSSSEETDIRVVSDSRLSILTDVFDEKLSLPEKLQKMENEIQIKEELLLSLSGELRLLDERERHFESLVEAYENVTAKLEEQTRERKELVTVREKETFPTQNQLSDSHGTEAMLTAHRTHDNAEDLNKQVARVDREIQLLQFQQTLLRQDYMLQLEVRPSLIRFADDLRIRIAEAERGLGDDKVDKTKLEMLLKEDENIESDSNETWELSEGNVDQNPDEDDVVQSQQRSDDKAAERKLELARLLAKPIREDTNGSTVTPETQPNTYSSPEPKRRKSHPLGQQEVSHKPAPAIKINNADSTKTQGSVPDSGSEKKMPQLSTIPSSRTFVATQSQTNPSTQSKPDTLFQRRVRKGLETETTTKKTSPEQGNRKEQPEPRPRAESDPRALKPTRKPPNISLEAGKRLKVPEANKPEDKTHTAVNGNVPSSKPKVGEEGKESIIHKTGVKTHSQLAAQKSKAAEARKKGELSQTPKESELRKTSPKGNSNKDSDATTKRVSNPGDATKNADNTPSRSKPSDAIRNSDTVPPRFKPGNTTRNADMPPRSKPGDAKRSEDKTPPGSKSGDATRNVDNTPPRSKSDGARKTSDVSSPSSKAVGVNKSGNVSGSQTSTSSTNDSPKQAAGGKTSHGTNHKRQQRTDGEVSSGKPTENDDTKHGGSASPQTKLDAKKQGRTVSPQRQNRGNGMPKPDSKTDSRATDVNKGADVASRGARKEPQPNGVIAREKRGKYA